MIECAKLFTNKVVCNKVVSNSVVSNSKRDVLSKARQTNPDTAISTADEIWVMHDVYLDWEGKVVKENKKEYDYNTMSSMCSTPNREFWQVRGFNKTFDDIEE
ncbi:MAG: hypothetical protein MJZ69_06745 [Bacteroidaceae bacterium]|nr:hypothetical protein [Bacteroidaceae bacterium]